MYFFLLQVTQFNQHFKTISCLGVLYKYSDRVDLAQSSRKSRLTYFKLKIKLQARLKPILNNNKAEAVNIITNRSTNSAKSKCRLENMYSNPVRLHYWFALYNATCFQLLDTYLYSVKLRCSFSSSCVSITYNTSTHELSFVLQIVSYNAGKIICNVHFESL